MLIVQRGKLACRAGRIVTRDDVQQTLIKPIVTAFIVPMLVGGGGAWVGVEIAIARLEERLIADEKIMLALHERIGRLEAINNDHTGGPFSEHREFRERITRLEEQIKSIKP